MEGVCIVHLEKAKECIVDKPDEKSMTAECGLLQKQQRRIEKTKPAHATSDVHPAAILGIGIDAALNCFHDQRFRFFPSLHDFGIVRFAEKGVEQLVFDSVNIEHCRVDDFGEKPSRFAVHFGEHFSVAHGKTRVVISSNYYRSPNAGP
jgi:hypothetical protein